MSKRDKDIRPRESLTPEYKSLITTQKQVEMTDDYASMLQLRKLLVERFHSRIARDNGSYKSQVNTQLIHIENKIRRYEMEESSEKNEKIGIKEIIKNKIGI